VTTSELKKELEEINQRLSHVRQFVISVLNDTPYFKDRDFLKLSFDEIVTLANSIIEIEDRLKDYGSQHSLSRKAGQS